MDQPFQSSSAIYHELFMQACAWSKSPTPKSQTLRHMKWLEGKGAFGISGVRSRGVAKSASINENPQLPNTLSVRFGQNGRRKSPFGNFYRGTVIVDPRAHKEAPREEVQVRAALLHVYQGPFIAYKEFPLS
jgi:hypothetical protein